MPPSFQRFPAENTAGGPKIFGAAFGMDAQSIFTVASMMVLANGAILLAARRQLPAMLRPAVSQWCLGTLLVALGGLVFAFGAPLPRPLMLTLANAAYAFGLTAYHIAIRQFLRLEIRAWRYLPAAAVTVGVLWFSWITPSFLVRIGICCVVWTGLMVMCIGDLRARGKPSLARDILAMMFAAIALYCIARAAVYLGAGAPADFAVETGEHWLNVLSPLLMTLMPVTGTTAFLLMCSDRLRRGLERAATTDYLTGLPNRRRLAQIATRAFSKARTGDGGFTVAVFDLDRFKAINDTHGHDAGDRALVHVANRLRRELGSAGVIARTGGEEFVVLFHGTADADAAATAERMRAAIEASGFAIGANKISLTVSAGLAVRKSGDARYDDVLCRADEALYRAKENGRNRLEIARSEEPEAAPRLTIPPPPLSAGEDTHVRVPAPHQP